MYGPNVKRLIIRKMSRDTIPDNGGFEDGLAFLMNREKLSTGARVAAKWVEEAIQCVRDAEGPNPWKNASDEEIAEAILKEIKEKERANCT